MNKNIEKNRQVKMKSEIYKRITKKFKIAKKINKK